MHQDDILPWLNAREHTSATSCQESGPLHKPARKDEEHGDQPAPFALVDQHEPFAQVARHAPFGQSDCSMGTGREASSHIGSRVPGFARRGSPASLLDAQNRQGTKKSAAPKSGAFPANYGRKPDPP